MMEDYFDLNELQPEITDERQSEPLANAVNGVTWPPHFQMRPDGLWFVPGGDKSEIWLSDPFVIEAEARDPVGSAWSLILSWRDRDNRSHRAVIRRADLAGDATDVRQVLADRGLTLAGGRSCKEKFLQALVGVFCATRVTLSDTTGWREGSFVLPHRTVGPAGCEPVLFQGRGTGTSFRERGTLEEWQEQVARPAGEHHRLAFALAIAFTGPLLEPLGIEGGGFHFFGPSSCGKTTALKVAGSVWGGGGERGFALTWRTTANALEGVAAAHNHTLLALDEIGQISPHDLDQATYALANGQAKARMRADGEIRSRARWLVPILSNGEVTVADRIREAAPGKRVRAGQEVRLVDVMADAELGYGIFDHAGGDGQASLLSQTFQSRTDHLYGTAGPAFVDRLITRHPDLVAVARELVSGVSAGLVPDGSDGQVRRVAQRFALVAAAGELAVELKVLPWARGQASDAVQDSFAAWLRLRGGGERREDQVAVEAVSHFLQRYGESRFAPVAGSGSYGSSALGFGTTRVVQDLVGWRRDGQFLIHAAGWQEITRGLDGRAVADVLGRLGYLAKGSDGKSAQSVQIEGRKQRVYVISAAILETGGAA